MCNFTSLQQCSLLIIPFGGDMSRWPTHTHFALCVWERETKRETQVTGTHWAISDRVWRSVSDPDVQLFRYWLQTKQTAANFVLHAVTVHTLWNVGKRAKAIHGIASPSNGNRIIRHPQAKHACKQANTRNGSYARSSVKRKTRRPLGKEEAWGKVSEKFGI